MNNRYGIVFRPGTYDTSFEETELTDINEIIKYAIGLSLSDDFKIVKIVQWKAVEENE